MVRLSGSRVEEAGGCKLFLSAKSATGYVGVIEKPNGRFQVQRTVGDKQVYIGTYGTAVEAAVAYARWRQEEEPEKLEEEQGPDEAWAAARRLATEADGYRLHLSRKSATGCAPLSDGGLLSWRATRLEAPAEQEVFFPSDHMFTGLGDLMRDQFLTGSEDQYERGKLYVGLAGLHQPPEYTRWKPDKNRGAAVWDDAFDLSVPAAQLAFLDMCEELRTAAAVRHGI